MAGHPSGRDDCEAKIFEEWTSVKADNVPVVSCEMAGTAVDPEMLGGSERRRLSRFAGAGLAKAKALEARPKRQSRQANFTMSKGLAHVAGLP